MPAHCGTPFTWNSQERSFDRAYQQDHEAITAIVVLLNSPGLHGSKIGDDITLGAIVDILRSAGYNVDIP